jgi:hypothetical protein
VTLDCPSRPRLFHVSRTEHEPGDIISHGRYGAASLEPTAKALHLEQGQIGALVWEAALETARLACAPGAVSRLRCVFAAETIALARRFRDGFRPDAGIYAVEPWHDAPLFRGDFGIVTDINPAEPFLSYMPAGALRYWTAPPGEQVEVLVGGPVTVLERVE